MPESSPSTHTVTRFGHQRLDVYRLALDLFVDVERIAGDLPRGHADLKDQVRRAAAATVRNIAEGANRVHPRDKAARFMVARGEVGECEAALQMIQLLELASSALVDDLRRKSDRIAAMLWGLIRRQRAEKR
jgi:four helix bundle protein